MLNGLMDIKTFSQRINKICRFLCVLLVCVCESSLSHTQGEQGEFTGLTG